MKIELPQRGRSAVRPRMDRENPRTAEWEVRVSFQRLLIPLLAWVSPRDPRPVADPPGLSKKPSIILLDIFMPIAYGWGVRIDAGQATAWAGGSVRPERGESGDESSPAFPVFRCGQAWAAIGSGRTCAECPVRSGALPPACGARRD
jgi:hypothetical protein